MTSPPQIDGNAPTPDVAAPLSPSVSPDVAPDESARARAIVRAALFGDVAGGPPKVGRYQLTRRIGGGGMGEVFAALDERLGRTVALKCVRSDRVGEAARTRILREARAMAKVSHPNVAPIHEVGEHEGELFIVMEFVQGMDLATWAVRTRPGWREVLEVYEQAGRGLAAAHAAQLVHRDFKPHNAILGDDGRVRVLDFGLVSDAGPAEDAVTEDDTEDVLGADLVASRLTRSGAVVGSPAYMSPEQYRGESADPSSDQFSFCVALYEALYGHRPFAGDSLPELATNVADGRVRGAPEQSNVPGWVRTIVLRGVCIERAERWPSMQALLDALERDPTRARRATAVAGVGIVGLLGIAGWWALDRNQTIADCRAEGESILASWTPRRVASLAESFAATDVSYAADAWERTEPRLTTYAQGWAQQRTEVCLGENVERTIDETRAAAARACLDRFRVQFESLVGQLEGADAEVVQRAVVSSARLPLLSSCADEKLLLLRPAPPPSNAEETLEIYRLMAQVTASASLGRNGSAVEDARKAAERADAIGDDALIAETRFLVGAQLAANDQHLEGVAKLEEAFYLADGSGDDELALRIATSLTETEAIVLARLDRAEVWHKLADARVRKLGLSEHLDAAALEGALGSLKKAGGDYEAAMAAHQRSYAIKKNVYLQGHPSLAAELISIGVLQFDLGEYRDALETMEEARTVLVEALGPTHPKIGSVLQNIANAKGILGELDESLAAYEQAKVILVNARGPDHTRVGDMLSNMGITLEMMGRLDEAEGNYRRALEIWEGAYGRQHRDIALGLTNLASLAEKRGEKRDAMQKHREAMEIWEATLGADHPDVATSLIHIGGLHVEFGEYEPGLVAHQRALSILETAHGPDHVYVAVASAGLGDAYRAQGQHPLALERYERALAIREAADAPRTDVADSQLDVARELIESGGDKVRALDLARAARDAFAEAGEERNQRTAEDLLR